MSLCFLPQKQGPPCQLPTSLQLPLLWGAGLVAQGVVPCLGAQVEPCGL